MKPDLTGTVVRRRAHSDRRKRTLEADFLKVRGLVDSSFVPRDIHLSYTAVPKKATKLGKDRSEAVVPT
jgi:hypothetical protein